MKSRIVPVKNVARLSAAAHALLNRAPGAPGIGLVEGVAGYGKSQSTAWLSNQVPSVYVRAMSFWTPAAMLGAILEAMGQPAGGSCNSMVKRIIEGLTPMTPEAPTPVLFLDEADYLADSKNTKMLDAFRDIHDMSLAPVVLIGEENLATKIQNNKRLASRVAQRVTFEPLDLPDTQLIAKELCEVSVSAELLEHIHQRVGGNCRYTVVALAQVEQLARAAGRKEVGLGDVKGKLNLVGAGARNG